MRQHTRVAQGPGAFSIATLAEASPGRRHEPRRNDRTQSRAVQPSASIQHTDIDAAGPASGASSRLAQLDELAVSRPRAGHRRVTERISEVLVARERGRSSHRLHVDSVRWDSPRAASVHASRIGAERRPHGASERLHEARSMAARRTPSCPYFLLWLAMYWAVEVSLWLTVPLAVLSGALLVRIFIIFHDCTHGSYFRSRRANDIVGIHRWRSDLQSVPALALGARPTSWQFRAISTGAAPATYGP